MSQLISMLLFLFLVKSDKNSTKTKNFVSNVYQIEEEWLLDRESKSKEEAFSSNFVNLIK